MLQFPSALCAAPTVFSDWGSAASPPSHKPTSLPLGGWDWEVREDRYGSGGGGWVVCGRVQGLGRQVALLCPRCIWGHPFASLFPAPHLTPMTPILEPYWPCLVSRVWPCANCQAGFFFFFARSPLRLASCLAVIVKLGSPVSSLWRAVTAPTLRVRDTMGRAWWVWAALGLLAAAAALDEVVCPGLDIRNVPDLAYIPHAYLLPPSCPPFH